IENTTPHTVPERGTMARFANRRSALELCRPVRNVLSGKRQIMRTRLGGDFHPVSFRAPDRVDGFSRGHVHDVNPDAEFLLKPRTPASMSGSRCISLPGTTPPQNATST